MPFIEGIVAIPLVPAGLTKNIPVTDSAKTYLITGTENLAVDNVFGHSGGLEEGLTYNYWYRGRATNVGGVVKFHGLTLTNTQALKNQFVSARYEGAAWNVDVEPDLSENAIIETNKLIDAIISTVKLQDKAVTKAKVEDILQGSIWIGDAGNRPVELPIGAASRFLQVVGGTAIWQVMSGDASLAAGVITIANNAVTTAKIIDGAVTLAKLETKLRQEVFQFTASGEVALQRTFFCKMPWACEVKEIDARIATVLVGGNMTINFKNNAGASMGILTPLLVGIVGDSYNSVPGGNNTFIAGQYMQITVSGAALTNGLVDVNITYERT